MECKSVDKVTVLLSLHVVFWPFQFPELRQVLEMGPDLAYSELHEKEARVPTVQFVFNIPPV